jgi:hypothetical protein
MKDDFKDLFLGGDGFADVQPAPIQESRRSSDGGHIGCPLSWFKLVFPIVRGKNELAVALYLYRLRTIRHSRTVRVSNSGIAELGIDRFAKYRALQRLADAGLISITRRDGRAMEVTFLR